MDGLSARAERTLLINGPPTAPGVDILSCLPGGDYAVWSGTAMTVAHVAGAVALQASAIAAAVDAVAEASPAAEADDTDRESGTTDQPSSPEAADKEAEAEETADEEAEAVETAADEADDDGQVDACPTSVGRGLKRPHNGVFRATTLSPPSRGRGLKLPSQRDWR